MHTSDLKEKAQQWQQCGVERVRNAGQVTAHYVRENTWTTLAIATLLGCVLGYLVARPRD